MQRIVAWIMHTRREEERETTIEWEKITIHRNKIIPCNRSRRCRYVVVVRGVCLFGIVVSLNNQLNHPLCAEKGHQKIYLYMISDGDGIVLSFI